ncbi:MAG TPA: hypothetical protein VHO03_04110 [Ignavibacteriales bacterium]|nr:hypothetical protein [Ignavibacteriales bacterium]
MKLKVTGFNFFRVFSSEGLKALAALSLVFCLLAPAQVFSQSLTNLEVFYKLADSSVVKVLRAAPKEDNQVYLRLNLTEGYSVFRTRIIQDLKQEGKDVLLAGDSLAPSLDLTIDQAKVNYSDLFRHGLFGSYKAERTVSLSGSYVLAQKGVVRKAENFTFTARDTVLYEDLRQLEDASIPFTRGNIPSEPLFSTLWEPVVALGTAAVAVYLFFTVRSK